MRDPLGEAVSHYVHHRDRTAGSKDPGKHPPPQRQPGRLWCWALSCKSVGFDMASPWACDLRGIVSPNTVVFMGLILVSESG